MSSIPARLRSRGPPKNSSTIPPCKKLTWGCSGARGSVNSSASGRPRLCLQGLGNHVARQVGRQHLQQHKDIIAQKYPRLDAGIRDVRAEQMADGNPHQPFVATRSDEHTSELQSLMRNSYAVFCL